MFTGIIEEQGTVKSIIPGKNSAVITIQCEKVLEGTKLGDSIALNGVCLTVISIGRNEYSADIMHETLRRSSLRQLKKGDTVNLERAMAAGGRFGGHIVSGHIDGTGTVVNIQEDDNAVWYTIESSVSVLKYIVEKGSVAIDGISLTVAEVSEQYFKVSTIPHTRKETNLSERKAGDVVNIECDVIGKYVERLINFSDSNISDGNNSRITKDFLSDNGFI